MASTYSVLQYLPDPLNDERINFGVVAVGDGEVHTRFVRRWQRIGSFGTGDVKFLKDFAHRIEATDPDQLLIPGAKGPEFNEELLDAMSKTWIKSIHVTPPRASTKAARDLIDDVARRFLRDTQPRRRRGRDRRAAVALADDSLQEALREAGGKRAQKLLKRDVAVKGAVEEQKFDLAAVNGEVRLGVLGLSFESQSPQDSLRNLHAAAWIIDDTKTANPELGVGVVMLPPKTRSTAAYERALYVIDALEADPVPEGEVDEWAARRARELVGGAIYAA